MVAVSARALRDLVVFAHHGCAFVDEVLASDRLSDAERAAFRAVDPRAFRADAERVHRTVGALLTELPVTIAIAGLEATYALLHRRDCFGRVVEEGLHLVLEVADALTPIAGDMARLEGALARSRRRRVALASDALGPSIVRADGVEVVAVDDAALPAFERHRTSLGTDKNDGGAKTPADVVAAGMRLPPLQSAGAIGWVLVEGGAVGGCSDGLATLLAALEAPTLWADAVAIARTLGCDNDDEAADLLTELNGDGLLMRGNALG